MPELPEAENMARRLASLLDGASFARVTHLRRDILRDGRSIPRWLAGAVVQGVERSGKRVVIRLTGGRSMMISLGMTGRLDVRPATDALPPHTHLRITLSDSRGELRFTDYRRFGRIRFFNGSNGGTSPTAFTDVGIEPLKMTLRQFRDILRRRRQIKALLMDQRAIAGLGNIYCDESLHRAGIHPRCIAADIEPARVARLCRSIKSILRAAIRAGGTTIINYQHPDGPGTFQRRLVVYGRATEPCTRCRTPIERIVTAGRSTHFCPSCQPAPFD